MEGLKMPYQRALILAAALCLTMSSAVQADCDGHDLFPALKSEAPAAYAAIETAAGAMPFRHGKLFRLSRPGSEPSYLFATLHLSDPRVTGFSPRLTATLTNSKIVVLETVETGDVLRRAVRNDPAAWRRATLARENHRADNLLSKTDFKQLESLAARRGFLKSVAREFNASTLALLLDLSACTVRLPGTRPPYLDQLIANIARENKIETVGLESMIEQIEILNGLPRETERDLLIAVLRRAERSEDFVETQIVRYAEGDIGGLLTWLQSAEPVRGVAQAQIPLAFVDRLVTLRNHRMRDRALAFLTRGGAFIAVGAVHLPGKEGLLSLFEAEGYHVDALE
ncbi:MAG: TraB/GumN family protein [Pseudolabrys sp.]